MKKFILMTTLCLTGISFNANALGNLADISVVDRTQNRTLPIYQYKGNYYVVGKPGNNYQIHLENRQADNIEAVISVDAVNVITGKTAKSSQTGYIFDAYNGYDIAGWRKNQDQIAAFYFTEIDNSYAARTGRSGNVGVIGVAIYNKKPENQYEPPMPSISRGEADASAQGSPTATQDTLGKSAPSRQIQHDSARSDKAMSPKPESKKLGTGHGAIESSYVTEVAFERASTKPAEIITIYYDSYKNLVAQGIVKPKARKPLARPFVDEANYGFVPDPS